MAGNPRCCRCCKAPCTGDFKKIAELQRSGLAIYIYTNKDEQDKENAGISFILHNAGNRQIKRPEYITELKLLTLECCQCKTIVHEVHKLLDEIKYIRENEVIGVCQHCRLAKSMKTTCEKCNYAVSKFLNINQKRSEEKKQRYKIWLCKLKHLLQSMIASENVLPQTEDPELERILKEFKVPLGIRQPDIDDFPSLDQEQRTSYQSLSENKKLLEELLSKIKFKGDTAHVTSESNLDQSPSKEMCLCKFLKGGYHEGILPDGTMVFGKPMEVRCRLLSYQEFHNTLIDRLLLLSKALQRAVFVDKKLKQEIINTINEVGSKGLDPILIPKLINQLDNLHITLPHDISKDLRKDGIQNLIKDLNNLLIQNPTRILNEKDLLKSVNERLITLKKALSSCANANEKFDKEIIETLNELMSEGLTTNVIVKLMEQLKDLQSNLTPGMSQYVTKNGLQELMDDLNDFLLIAASKKASKDLLHLLVDLTDMINIELTKKIDEKNPEKRLHDKKIKPTEIKKDGMSPKSFQPPQMKSKLQKKDEEDKTQNLPSVQSEKDIEGLKKAESKYSTHGLPKGTSKTEKIDDIPSGQTEDVLKDQRKDKQELSKSLSKKSMQGLSKTTSRQIGIDPHDVLKTRSKESALDLSRGLSKKSMQRLTKAQSKNDALDLSGDIKKKSVHGLTEAQSKQSTLVLPREQNEVDTNDVLKTQSREGPQDLARGLSKKSLQRLTIADSKHAAGIDETKAEAHELTEGLTKAESRTSKEGARELTEGLPKAESRTSKEGARELTEGLPKAESRTSKEGARELTEGLPKAESRTSKEGGRELTEGLPKAVSRTSQEGARDLAKGLSKKSMQRLTIADSKHAAVSDETKDEGRELTEDLIKAESRTSTHNLTLVQSQHETTPEKPKQLETKMSREQIKKSMLDIPLSTEESMAVLADSEDGKPSTLDIDNKRSLVSVRSKEDTHDLPKASAKDQAKDLKIKRSRHKDLHKTSRKQSKLNATAPEIEVPISQIKLTASLSAKSTALVTIHDAFAKKTQTEGKSESSKSETSLIDPCIALAQKLTELNNALTSRTLDKKLIKELVKDINETLGEPSPDLLNNIIRELVNLCKPAISGVPKTSNIKKVQRFIKDAGTTLGKGLSEDENKLTLQSLLNNLHTTLTTEAKERDLRQRMEREKRYLKPPSKRDLKIIRALAVKQSKQENVIDKGTEKDKKLETKTDKTLATSADSAPDGQKQDSKSKKSPSITSDTDRTPQKTSLEKEAKSKKPRQADRMPRKTRMELTNKKGKIKHQFGDDDDSLDLEPSESELKEKIKKSPKAAKSKKDKETEAKKSKELKSKSLSTIEIRKPKQVSESKLRKLLSANKLNAARYAVYMARKRKQEKELEKRRLRELGLKNMSPRTKKKKIIAAPPTPDDTSIIVECEFKRVKRPKSMIKGETIVPYDPHYKDHKDIETKKEPEPLFFKTDHKFTSDFKPPKPEYDPNTDYEAMFRDGIVRYRLSNREFIDNGWTVLPTKKVMKRLNIYRMQPANPKYDWFELHKREKELFYDSGQRLAYIDRKGRGHWYYKNGTVALDYYNAKESNIGQRYVVYSTGTDIEESGKVKPRTILALFDALGNGVVYDHYGNIRLKYNQTEGLLVDSKVGPPGKWKWHSLNDPPVLQQVFVDEKEHDRKLDRASRADKAQETMELVKHVDPEMMAIELDHFTKEKSSNLLKKFKAFQIRMKAVKLNDHFSVKILDQSKITLHFRDGATTLKLQLGMHLISDEIIDTDTSDIAEVSTPYDKYPARTHSLENIQKILNNVRSGKLRHSLEATVKSVG